MKRGNHRAGTWSGYAAEMIADTRTAKRRNKWIITVHKPGRCERHDCTLASVNGNGNGDDPNEQRMWGCLACWDELEKYQRQIIERQERRDEYMRRKFHPHVSVDDARRCKVCGWVLEGRQRAYCSPRCEEIACSPEIKAKKEWHRRTDDISHYRLHVQRAQ